MHSSERPDVDLFGPVSLYPTKQQWAIAAIDHLTRYVFTAALPTESTAEIESLCIHKSLHVYGAPRVLISFYCRPFLAQLLRNNFSACSALHKLSSSYHPQKNGLIEHFNHTHADMLSDISGDHTNWDILLPDLTFACNTAVQFTTSYSSLCLLFGQEPLTNFDILFPYVPISKNVTRSNATWRSDECRQLALFRTFDSQGSAKLQYDDQHRHIEYIEGDLV